MRDIDSLRRKYWSGRDTLYPRTTSKCEHKYRFVGMRKHAFIAAQDDARDALMESDKSQAEKLWNRATYRMTDAYMGDDVNDKFWEQFI